MSDDERKRESHIGDALAHAMIPPTEAPPAEPALPEPDPAQMQSAIAQDEVIEHITPEMMSDEDGRTVYSGEVVARIEQMWPLLWLAMLTVVSVIGIYNAVRHLP